MTRTRTAGFGIVALLLIGLLLLSACGGDDDAGDETPTPDAESSADAGDCGHVGEINSPNEIANALIALRDLPEGFTVAPADPRGIEFIGDTFFQENINPETYAGGRGFAFGTGEALDGGQGRFVAAVVVAFTTEESASLLVAHPSTGEPTVVETVDAAELGDESEALYFEIDSREGQASGYIYQFRAGQMVAYVANVGSGEEVTLEDTEAIAALMCQRARELPASS